MRLLQALPVTLSVVLRARHLCRPAFRQRLALVQRRYLRLSRLRRLRASVVSVFVVFDPA